MATLNNGGHQNGGGVSGNCLINLQNHSMGLNDQLNANQINFTNGAHFTTGGNGAHFTNGGVDSGGGNSCNNIGKIATIT